MSKKLSIITICYNEPNLEKTCESIVNQTWQDFEWIVVDAVSDEETQKVWDKYKHRIDKFISEHDRGRYNAMNKGIQLATGEYLNFLNAGDWYFYDNVLKDVFYNNHYEGDILYGNECFLNSQNIFLSTISYMPDNLSKEFFFCSTIRHQASFIRKSLFDKYGFYNEENQVASDYEKWFVFMNKGAIFEALPYTITYFNTEGISSDKETRDINGRERNKIIDANFTESEIKILEEKYQMNKKNSFLERIFSIKNDRTRLYKIVMFFGIKLKIKRQ